MKNGKKQREKRREYARELVRLFGPLSVCGNCGELFRPGNGHFVPPSLGEDGFFACAPKP